MESQGITGYLEDHPEETLELAKKLVQCELPENNVELRGIVSEVQRHHHTKSCLKYNGQCRYGFPRLPSPKYILAQPLPEDMDEKEKEKILSDAKDLFSR